MTTCSGYGSERRWNRLRFVLGMAQMSGALIALLPLLQTGVTVVSLGAVLVTSILTSLSVMLSGTRRKRRPESPGAECL